MLAKLRAFIRTTILGGVAVLLPVALFIIVYSWLYGVLAGMIEPLTAEVEEVAAPGARYLAQGIAIGIIVLSCFLVGLAVRTRIGRFVRVTLDERLLKRFPGYTLIRETVSQFFGKRKFPFSSVALVQPFGNDTMMTAFVTEKHDTGMTTVYVPACPSPMVGNVYHLPDRFVHPIDIPVEVAMRSIFGCGAGAGELLTKVELSG